MKKLFFALLVTSFFQSQAQAQFSKDLTKIFSDIGKVTKTVTKTVKDLKNSKDEIIGKKATVKILNMFDGQAYFETNIDGYNQFNLDPRQDTIISLNIKKGEILKIIIKAELYYDNSPKKEKREFVTKIYFNDSEQIISLNEKKIKRVY